LQRLGRFRFGRSLRQALAGTLEPTCQPKLWRFVDALPGNVMGKTRDADIRALFARSEDHPR
jgi:hypothetical protein